MGCSPEARLHGATAGRICVFALIGLQAKRLMGGPDVGVNRRVGQRGSLEVRPSSPLRMAIYLPDFSALSHGKESPHLTPNLHSLTHSCGHPFIPAVKPISNYISYLCSSIKEKKKTKQRNLKSLELLLTPLPYGW